MGAKDVRAGGAEVVVELNDTPFETKLTKAEMRLKAFGRQVLAIGAGTAGFGVGLGTALMGSVKSFASLGTELDTITKKMATVDKTSAEFATLSKEAERLTRIMGGSDVAAAAKLSQALVDLSDSVKGVIVKVGAGLAPVLSDVIGYLKRGVEIVGQFIDRNRALAPQAAIVVTAITAVGTAIAALGTAFWALGPVIRLTSIIWTASCAIVSLAIGTVTTTVGIATTVFGVLTGVISFAGAALRALGVVTIAVQVVWLALSIVVKAVSIAFGIAAAIVSTVTLFIMKLAAITLLAKVGLLGLAGALKTLMFAQSVMAVLSGLATVIGVIAGPIVAVSLAVGALTGAFYLLGPIVRTVSAEISAVFVKMATTVATTFSQMAAAGMALPGQLVGNFGSIVTAAKDAFGGMYNVGRTFLFDLLGTAQGTFKGISDAISGGDIQLAMDVLWAGLKVTWQQGLDFLQQNWERFTIAGAGIFDAFATALNAVWDTIKIYGEGALDGLGAMLKKLLIDAETEIEKLTNILNPLKSAAQRKLDNEVADRSAKVKKSDIDNAVERRGEGRQVRIGELTKSAKDDFDKRQSARKSEMDAIGSSGPSTALMALQTQLVELMGKAAALKPTASDAKIEAGKAGADIAKTAGEAMKSAAAQARNSAGAASTIAGAVNRSLTNPNAKMEAKLDEVKKLLGTISKKPGLTFVEYS